MLTGLGRRPDNLQVQAIRGGDTDRLHFRVLNHLTPIDGVPFKAKAAASLNRPALNIITTYYQAGFKLNPPEAFQNLLVGPAMSFPHPAHADHSNSDPMRHGHLF